MRESAPGVRPGAVVVHPKTRRPLRLFEAAVRTSAAMLFRVRVALMVLLPLRNPGPRGSWWAQPDSNR